ncbi:MAG: YgaP family membrane protein [Acidimicrobiales bacterium]
MSTSAGKKQRILFLLAGTFTVTGTVLAASVSPWFALIPGVVGANQLLMSAVGWCPMSKFLDRLLPEPTIRVR